MSNEIQNKYEVIQVLDEASNALVRELWFDERGKLGRTNGPALQEFDPTSGMLLKRAYYLHGRVHRPEEDGPAYQNWSPKTGKLTSEGYQVQGKGHRSGGKPALIDYDEYTGEITRQWFMEHGVDIDPQTGKALWDDPVMGDIPVINKM